MEELNESPPVILYGAGNNAITVLAKFRENNCNPVCFIDSNPNKQLKNHLGLPVLSLEEVNVKYGVNGYNVYITPNPPFKFEICHSLLNCGVPKENILNYEESVERLGCNSLENCLLIFNNQFHYCCALGNLRNDPPYCKIPDDISSAVDTFVTYREQLIGDLQDESKTSPCTGCLELKRNYYPVNRKIRSISFSPSYPCNLRCSYCDVPKTAQYLDDRDKAFLETFDFAGLVKELEKRDFIDALCPIEISAGEITINPRCGEILDAVKNYPVLLFSNCVVYDDRVLEVIKRENSFLLESLDAGTRHFYAKIKGKDVFDTVLENIAKYASHGGNIQLKYIVMPENCNDQDLKGFLDFCNKIKPMKIRISCDINNDFNHLPQQIIDFAIRLGQEAVAQGHEVLVLQHFGKKNDKYIQQQIFDI